MKTWDKESMLSWKRKKRIFLSFLLKKLKEWKSYVLALQVAIAAQKRSSVSFCKREKGFNFI